MSVLKIKLKNVTNAKTYISNILQKYKDNDIVNDLDVIELLSYHPTKHINKQNIDYLIMKTRKPYNKLALFYKYKNNDIIDDVSYILCIKNLFGKYNRDKQYEEDVMTAFRNESHIGTKKQYFIDNTKVVNDIFIGVCSNCNVTTKDITTDHYLTPYKQLFETFIKDRNITLSEVDVFENEQNEIRIKCECLATEWRLYHDNNAEYRLLCKSCNSHFGSYGFK
jgi:hypothetical protein